MGLDIYLYRYDKPRQQVERENEKWEAASSAIYTKLKAQFGDGKWSDSQHKTWSTEEAEEAKKFGRVGKWHDNPSEVKIEENSAKYPDHLFKVGYFRSSYNESGINGILRDRIGQDLYDILGVSHDAYVQRPNWKAALTRCESAIDQLSAVLRDKPFAVTCVSGNFFNGPSKVDSAQALEIASKELSMPRGTEHFTSYNNRDGAFFTKGLTIYAAIHGTDCLGQPATYLVTKDDGEGDEGLAWYVHALEIVAETCRYVIAQPDPSKFYLHVSG